MSQHTEKTKIGVMLCGHGSRSEAASREFSEAAEAIKARLAARPESWPLAHGYLEFANPVIRVGLDSLREQGCNHILAAPGMLFAAGHAKNDIPSVLKAYAAEHNLRIDYGRDLGVHPNMLEAARDRIQTAIDQADAAGETVPLAETCLVVIGRGASDPDANSDVAKVARLLWEGMGFGWCSLGYSGVTFPLVEPSLEHAAKLGYKRIIVFPYFLFSGVLIDRIYGFTDWVAERTPDVEFVKASYLGQHPKVIDTFIERIEEILTGNTAMNCGMCKYRTAVLGFEAEIGAAQESHHHHVEGQGASAPGSNVADCTLCEAFCTGVCRLSDTSGDHHHHHHGHGHHHGHDHHHDHDHHHGHDHHHDHDHHHAPYPHADHPLGPESVRKHLKTDP